MPSISTRRRSSCSPRRAMPAKLASPDDWWMERRLIARKLLDTGDYQRAYRICAEHSAASERVADRGRVPRRLDRPALPQRPGAGRAAFRRHGADRAEAAIAGRAAYWRAAPPRRRGQDAQTLLRPRRERDRDLLRPARARKARRRACRPARRRRRRPKARRARSRCAPPNCCSPSARRKSRGNWRWKAPHVLTEPEQMAALSRLIEDKGDARIALIAGKAALHRGLAIDSLAFPLNGVPRYSRTGQFRRAGRWCWRSRGRKAPSTPRAQSGAGAFGLMQMIEPAPRARPRKAPASPMTRRRLKTDAAFNAQLGAFHLGQLLGEYRGSYILDLRRL